MKETESNDYPPEFLEALAFDLLMRPDDLKSLNEAIQILGGDPMKAQECEK